MFFIVILNLLVFFTHVVEVILCWLVCETHPSWAIVEFMKNQAIFWMRRVSMKGYNSYPVRCGSAILRRAEGENMADHIISVDMIYGARASSWAQIAVLGWKTCACHICLVQAAETEIFGDGMPWSKLPKTHDFVFKALLSSEDRYKRAFRMSWPSYMISLPHIMLSSLILNDARRDNANSLCWSICAFRFTEYWDIIWCHWSRPQSNWHSHHSVGS
jgi:hypothetical protein